MIELPQCRWSGREIGPGRQRCHSPKLVVGPDGVDASKCSPQGCYCHNHDWVKPILAGGRCRHLGRENGRRLDCKPCEEKTGRRVQLKLHDCGKYGECTLAAPTSTHAGCEGCPSRAPFEIEWLSFERLAADARLLAGKIPHDARGIAGVPRSGMLPASIIATMLHLPLWELTEDGRLNQLGAGSRWWSLARKDGPLVVVDDSVCGGGAMARSRAGLAAHGVPGFFAAVYVMPEAAHVVDVYTALVPSPQIFEWNIWNNAMVAGIYGDPIYRAGMAADFDGVLCQDPDVPDADDGPNLERYRQWMIGAKPQWLPRRDPVPLIVTARLERFRPETEEWLRRHGCRWDRLVMHPAARASQRGDVAAWKATEYAASKCGFFVESDPGQAAAIFAATGRYVICPATGRVFQ